MSIGQLATLDNKVHQYSIRYGSLLLRALELELADRPDDESIKRVAEGLREKVSSWRTSFGQGTEWRAVPIRQLVAVQVEAVIAAASLMG